jgi:hypothetical protein
MNMKIFLFCLFAIFAITRAFAQEPDSPAELSVTVDGIDPDILGTVSEDGYVSLPGLNFILDNMFANQGLRSVVIPGQVEIIGINAFAGNPLISIEIGANVLMAGSAFPGNFAKAYNSYGKVAGTYTRLNVDSEVWTKQ